MLLSLTVHNIVLIDRLHMDCGDGLTVLTGETGAGKSILLDSLGLALGARADTALLRHGARDGSVTAVFAVADDHPAVALLSEQGIEGGEEIYLRRALGADGRSRAFINDQPVSAGLLRQVGDLLVEIHGQHDDRGLLDARGHRALLDAFAGHDRLLDACAVGHAAWRDAEAALADARNTHEAAQRDEEYLRHAVAELMKLDPQPGEEAALANQRILMQKGEMVAGGLREVVDDLTKDGGIDAVMRGALRKLERLAEKVGDVLDDGVQALDRAAIETAEAVARLESTLDRLEFDPAQLEAVEARLFDIRAAARKHKCAADDLPALRVAMDAQLEAIDSGGERLEALAATAQARRQDFAEAVMQLSTARAKAAKKLDKAVAAELAPLKLEKARFRTAIQPLGEADWTNRGGERVAFEVSTNPGAPFGPLLKIASGGELARFILALKVALADRSAATTMIFDEVDRGVGGATASAVGERLARLAETAQVIVVTHSPQVAARGTGHWRIDKREANGATVTAVARLDDGARREELARMLSGERVTDAARAAAVSLLEGMA